MRSTIRCHRDAERQPRRLVCGRRAAGDTSVTLGGIAVDTKATVETTAKKKLNLKIRKLEKVETTILRGDMG
jgi:hypothetical protein